MDRREYRIYSDLLSCASFFWRRDYGVSIIKEMTDWREHTEREWELEYDALYRGTNADYRMPLWASVFLGDKALLNQTTLEVIQTYHKWGYEPVRMEGNPPDYIGEQFRFLAYLTAAGIYASEHGENDVAEEIWEEREAFILYYTCGEMRMMKDAAMKNKTYQGYINLLEKYLVFLADENHEKGGFPLPEGFQDEELEQVKLHGRHAEIPNEKAHVIPTGGLNNCGGICVIRPTVQEGCMLSIESDCTSNHPQIRACVRGCGYRKTFLNPDRLRYPMKQIGERGSGKFERISWDEAISIIYENWVRIRDTYGPGSRYLIYGTGVTGIMRPGNLIKRLLAMDGGYLDYFNSYSSAQVNYIMNYVYGSTSGSNSAADLLNTKLLILWGHNPSETIFGPERNYYLSELKKKDVRVIAIDPRLNNTAAAYADEWIAPRPATDCALADAMAYVIWSEGLQDQHFMDTYCIGFDEEHMPEGVPWGESYHTYLFGEKDGVPKTPEWAEPITGVRANVIRRLARELATTRPACIQAGLGLQRHGNGEQNARGIMMLSCLTGNVGIPGGSPGGNASNLEEHNTPSLFTNKVTNPYPGKIPVFLWTKAIEHGTEMTPREDRLKGVDHLDSNIKMLFNIASNTLINQHSDINDTIRILKDDTKCEFILCSDIFMTPSARYADVVLPATSVFEGNNIVASWAGGNYFLRNNKVVEPLFDCRFEWEWIKEIAGRLGIREEFTDHMEDAEDWLRANYEILREKEPGLPEYEEFCRLGGWQYSDPINGIPFYDQIHDPEHARFHTPSGKIEIFSKELYDFGQPDDIPAIPKYVPTPRGYEDPLREKYLLQLIGWHTRRRCHSIHDNNEWQDEVEMPSVWMNPADADSRGIENGDLVEVYNEIGRVRLPATLTNRIMEGVAAMSQGAWYTPDADGTDIRGSINVLTSAAEPSPLAKGNPQHTNLVEICAATATK
ncbi:MAG: molybdopterin-dependent oxidoreductase [Clostridiales bacterium]|nr:molybdopterin-dependent oxidoreductase [Clostridiales bacterium]